MKTYLYWEYREPYPDHPTEMTEDSIYNTHWDFFYAQMNKRFGPDFYLTTKEGCIEDWVIMNWAWEKI